MSEKFLVDSNFWITCENELYPRRHFPTFWSEIEKYLADGTILHHWSVADELKRKDDDVSEWIADLVKKGEVTVIARPKETPDSYIEVCAWPQYCIRPHAQPYKPEAISEFRETARADAWLCAQALDSGYTLVTREKPQPQIISKVKIPDVCAGMGISCLTFNECFDAIDLVV